jgi:hypothetical protein
MEGLYYFILEGGSLVQYTYQEIGTRSSGPSLMPINTYLGPASPAYDPSSNTS